MSNSKKPAIQFLLPTESYSRGASGSHLSATRLPRILGGITRSATAFRNPFINDHVLEVESTFDLTSIARGSGEDKQATPIDGQRILSLEAVDGSTLIIRADKLQAELEHLYPTEMADNNGQIDFGLLQDNEATARGVSSWIWAALSVLNLKPDGLVELAKDKALELLKDKLGEEYEDLAFAGASWAGAKTLMWAIESRLEGEPGLYRWEHTNIQPTQRLAKSDEGLQKAADDGQPILVFIHGLASSTSASFADLRKEKHDQAYWDALTRQFNGHVYGFEHRTLSESPLENALDLAKLLPANAKVSFVTHSRGGLVGDLLCSDKISDDMIERFQRKPVLPEVEEGDDTLEESDENKRLREAITKQEQAQLRELREILKNKSFNIQRYIRVAAPASGTTLLVGNLDLFLSGLLSLMSFSVGFVPVVGAVGSTMLSAFRRVMIESSV